jgi:hypothetical protein
VVGAAADAAGPAVPASGTDGSSSVVPAAGSAAPAGTGGAGALGVAAGAAASSARPTRAVGPSQYTLYDAASSELRAPAPGAGVQLVTPAFDLEPGAETFACYHAELPIDGEIDVRYYESKMATGSHHFILYKMDGDATALGTLEQSGCAGDFSKQNWIYSAAQPHIDLQVPEGVAVVLKSRQRVLFDMHAINSTLRAIRVQVTLNVVLAKGDFQPAASVVSSNDEINIPPFGTQTVSTDCTPGPEAKYFYLVTHTHRRGTLATVARVLADGTLGEELVRSTSWEAPQDGRWLSEPLLTFAPGEKLRISCSYRNDLPQVVTVGPSAAVNEMCMLIGYYFPATAGASCD